MRLRSNATETAKDGAAEAAQQAELERAHFDARIERGIEEGPVWIRTNLGVKAEFTGRVQQKDAFNPGGVVFKLLDDEGYAVADNFSGRIVSNLEHREALSFGVYVNDPESTNGVPYLVMPLYAPDEEKFVGTNNVKDAADFWDTLNTTMHQRGPNDPAYCRRVLAEI